MEEQWLTIPPREKLLQKGARVLTDEELLAIFLRTGAKGVHVMTLAAQLIEQFGSLYQLMTAGETAFKPIKGMGVAKYAQLNAIAELGRRFFTCNEVLEHQCVESVADMLSFLRSTLAHREREIFMVVFLDNQHQMLHHCEMFAGTINSVEVHPREIVREALKHNAAALILAHNHPSGLSRPSKADKEITRQIIAACQLMKIRVLDHLVIGHGEYVSFAERGWL
ncbi:DNA repair protein RadC [Pantoea sp. BAV 3049]|uniref:RadC family protein n=1 Tax=Pantoea sp. BAV 3049 TaxID=2654188 RepID=UPI00131C1134|nr:DNA repair protein RadC [Pantoea sp. BAV 3049]